MKFFKKTLVAFIGIAAIAGFSGVAFAGNSGQFLTAKYDTDGTTVISNEFPLRQATTTALMGARDDSDSATWFYPKKCLTTEITDFEPGDGKSGNYNLNVDTNCVGNHLSIYGLSDSSVLDSFVSTSTFNSLATIVSVLQVPFDPATFFSSTSTALYIANASSTGLMSADMAIKLSGLAQSNWTATSGPAFILNKPSIGTGSVTSVGATSTDMSVTGGPITASGSLTLTLNNTGITAGSYGAVTVTAKGLVTAGKRMETYSGTTNGSGVYAVTFGTAYSSAPNIQANLINGSDTQSTRITSISTTGFTVLARNRTDVAGLLPAYANATGMAIDALITEK